MFARSPKTITGFSIMITLQLPIQSVYLILRVSHYKIETFGPLTLQFRSLFLRIPIVLACTDEIGNNMVF